MSSQKTNNLSLHQWGSSDAVSRAEFNENFALIDSESAAIRGIIAAVAGTVPVLKLGSYVGNGGTISIDVGFQPKAVVLCTNIYTTIITPTGGGALTSLTANGFRAGYDDRYGVTFNSAGAGHTYIAIG